MSVLGLGRVKKLWQAPESFQFSRLQLGPFALSIFAVLLSRSGSGVQRCRFGRRDEW